MVQPILSAFQWGPGGKPVSPAAAKRDRDVASALLSAKPQGTGFWGFLGQAGSALAGAGLNRSAALAEKEGQAAAANVFSGLGSGSSIDAIAQALASPAAAWATPAQQGVAEALMNTGLKRQDPAYQLDLQYKQAQLDQMRYGGGADQESFFGNPIPIQTPEGLQYGQIGNRGSFRPIDIGEGNQFLAPVTNLDVGTGFAQVPKFGGDPTNVVPIDNVTPARDTAVGTGLGQQQLTTIDAGRVAAGNNAKLGVLETLLGAAPQGGQGRLVQLAGGLGVDLGGLTEVQAAQAVINQMVPLQRAPGSGTMSDMDLELYKASLPSIINQPESNALIISTQKALNDYTIAHANIEQQLVTGQINEATAMSLKQSIPNPVAGFLAATRGGTAPAASLQPAAPASGGYRVLGVE